MKKELYEMLTESQREAIFSENKSLLVSAGAGSGKTFVLTQRLTEMLIKGATLDDFLVVTYTEASAADLKEKLYNTISEALSEAEPNSRVYKSLYEQLYLLSGARISTIHAFCYELIKHNFSALGISPDCGIADETESDTILSDTLADMLSDMFESENADVLLLLDRICPQSNEKKLSEILTDVYKKVRAFYRYDVWLSDCASDYREDADRAKTDLFATKCGRWLREETVSQAKRLLTLTTEAIEFITESAEKLSIKKFLDASDKLRLIINAGTYGAMIDAFNTKIAAAEDKKKVPPSVASCFFKTNALLDDFFKKCKELYEYDTADFSEVFKDCAATVDALRNVITELDKRFFAAKAKKSLLDFADLEQLTVRLLEDADGNPSDVCRMLRISFKQVFIDEYQDVNPLQDRIFTLLSRDDDRFMVGDVKQSIYKFRNAYPSIFLGYKQRFGDKNDDKNDVVFLKENFRCARNVINFTNLVTSFASSGTDMESEYRDEELVFARKSGDESAPVTIALAEYKEKEQKSADESCARYIAAEIKRLVKSGVAYGEIAVLFSALKGVSVPYEHALARAGVPYKVMRSTGFLDKPEVTMALACLSAIDNPTDDVALFSMMRSPMFGFDADELYKIRKSNNAYSFITCVRIFAAAGHCKKVTLCGSYRIAKVQKSRSSLIAKAGHFLHLLEDYRMRACGMQTHKFLWYLYETSGLLAIASAEGEHQRANLLKLYQNAAAFEGRSFKGITAFRAYMERLTDQNAGVKGAQLEDTDCVKLMSIHASKGLEYKVCFVANTDKKFNSQSSSLLIGYRSGISFTLFYPDKRLKRDTPSRKVALFAYQSESTAEELRKLYVAMTRAKDRLYLVGIVPKKEDEKPKAKSSGTNSELGWILGAMEGQDLPYVNRVDITDYDDFSYQPKTAEANNNEELKADNIGYKYPYAEATSMPAKISVSQLHVGLLEEQEYGTKTVTHAVPAFASDTASAGQKGTANHLFMQFCNMQNAASSGSKAEAGRLLAERFITQKQYEMLDYTELDRFFAGELYAEIKSATHVWREKRFAILDKGNIIGGPKDEELLVQGVIDCFYQTKDGIVVVDYKTDRVFGSDAADRLIERHKLQIRYYCKAVSEMMGRPVHKALLYSFSLGRAVEVPLV